VDAADDIWNRACDPCLRDQSLRPGDRALRDALAAHSVLMNGGLGHALEVLGGEETENAVNGFRYLDAEDIAHIFRSAAAVAGDALAGDADERQQRFLRLSDDQVEDLEALEREYWALVPSDEVLEGIFRRYWRRHPERFAAPSG
jgi:hypothetical protein